MRRKKAYLKISLWLSIVTILGLIPNLTASSVSGKSLTSNTFQGQDYKVYLPLVMKTTILISEIDGPLCRWSRTPGGFAAIPYKWGDNLQNPGSSWKIAFETAISDWYLLPTKVYYYFSSDGPTVFNTYYQDDGWGGKSISYCDGTNTLRYEIYGNSFYSQTTNGYHAYAGHETGHGQSLGHIANQGLIAIMGYNPDIQNYYVPQPPDVDFVNQIYP